MGDAVLREIGHRLQAELRESDTVARLGGDEFAVMLPGVGQSGAELAARKLHRGRAAAAAPSKGSISTCMAASASRWRRSMAPKPKCSCSARTSRCTSPRKIAPAASVYAPELDRHSPERLALMGDFRHAISRDELRVVYQPKINLKTREIFGVEALVRWQHPQLGLILPDRFIPMAEQTGAVRPLTLWMLERAVQQCLEWKRLGTI